MKLIRSLLLLVVILSLSYASYNIIQIVRWKMYIWLPSFIAQQMKQPEAYTGIKHIIFVVVDHYEPGLGARGAANNREWLASYNKLIEHHKDSYGRPPQHTFFYAYDHHNEQVMSDLASYVKSDHGEIEFHWHHKHDNNETYSRKLAEGVAWFNRFGAMIDAHGNKSFAFIHGDWSLDNSLGDNFCGVSRELEILKSQGCYADFTFPAFGNQAQPKKINSIYYAKDDERSKSYDNGIDVKVGSTNSRDLMIVEGPLTLTDYGAIENDPYPNTKKIDSWVKANIHVKGRPEWIFIKTFTHGEQSKKLWFGTSVPNDMFTYLEKRYGVGQYRLHYVTAREAYNIIRAAEDGRTGDPQQYLNYKIFPPRNKISSCQ